MPNASRWTAKTETGALMMYVDELIEFHRVPARAKVFLDRLVFHYGAFQRWASVSGAELAGDATHRSTVIHYLKCLEAAHVLKKDSHGMIYKGRWRQLPNRYRVCTVQEIKAAALEKEAAREAEAAEPVIAIVILSESEIPTDSLVPDSTSTLLVSSFFPASKPDSVPAHVREWLADLPPLPKKEGAHEGSVTAASEKPNPAPLPVEVSPPKSNVVIHPSYTRPLADSLRMALESLGQLVAAREVAEQALTPAKPYPLFTISLPLSESKSCTVSTVLDKDSTLTFPPSLYPHEEQEDAHRRERVSADSALAGADTSGTGSPAGDSGRPAERVGLEPGRSETDGMGRGIPDRDGADTPEIPREGRADPEAVGQHHEDPGQAGLGQSAGRDGGDYGLSTDLLAARVKAMQARLLEPERLAVHIPPLQPLLAPSASMRTRPSCERIP